MLISALKSHPEVHARGEIFQRIGGRDFADILRTTAPRRRTVKAVGFKLIYNHPLDRDLPELWDYLQSDRSIRVIHLKRRNFLETHLSSKIAASHGVWKRRKAPTAAPLSPVIEIPPNELKRAYEETQKRQQLRLEQFVEHPLLDIDYEDFLADEEAAFLRLCDFLSVTRRRPQFGTVRQAVGSPEQVIANFEELATHFADTELGSAFRPENFGETIIANRTKRGMPV